MCSVWMHVGLWETEFCTFVKASDWLFWNHPRTLIVACYTGNVKILLLHGRIAVCLAVYKHIFSNRLDSKFKV